jgi:hypothetical protein
MAYFKPPYSHNRNGRNLFPPIFFLVFFLFIGLVSKAQELDLERRFYIAADCYKEQQLVTGMLITTDSLGTIYAHLDLLLDWVPIDSATYSCQIDLYDSTYTFEMYGRTIPALRLYNDSIKLEILIEKPVMHESYSPLGEKSVYWISRIAQVNMPERFRKYWLGEVLFHEK